MAVESGGATYAGVSGDAGADAAAHAGAGGDAAAGGATSVSAGGDACAGAGGATHASADGDAGAGGAWLLPLLPRLALAALAALGLALLNLPAPGEPGLRSAAAAASAASARARARARAAAAAGAPVLLLFGDSVDALALSEYCERSDALQLCLHGRSRQYGRSQQTFADGACGAFHEITAGALHEPGAEHYGLMTCLPADGVGGGGGGGSNGDGGSSNGSGGGGGSGNGGSNNSSGGGAAAADGAASLALVYNMYGATNQRSPRYSSQPPPNASFLDIFAAPFGLVPELLQGRLPTAVVVHGTFWDLLMTCDALTERGYAELTRDPAGGAALSWLSRFSEGVGELLAAAEALSSAWPVTLRLWRTANLVNGETGFWQRDANALIQRANAAAAAVARARRWALFDFERFLGSGELRDAHHPVSAPLVAAVEALIAEARRSQADAARAR